MSKTTNISMNEENKIQQHQGSSTTGQPEATTKDDCAPILIAGAGIVGLVLALSLNKEIGVKPEIYEQATAFQDGIGNGIGMYPNGLRVIRSISPELLSKIRSAGYPYLCRRWERHDGTQVIEADESALSEEEDLQPMGVRRWRLQKILQDEVKAQGIPIYFGKKITQLETSSDETTNGDKTTIVHFEDGTVRVTSLLLAADGAKSRIRSHVAGETSSKLTSTGTTCLFGSADIPTVHRGISFPSSVTSNCHGCFYPTGPNEQCFQFHFPSKRLADDNEEEEEAGGWSALARNVGVEECKDLAVELENDGWHEKFLSPLKNAIHAIKVPLGMLDAPLKNFVFGRVALVGDAAHPPVPYLGQGAQQGLEDAGTLSLILNKTCLLANGQFSMTHIDQALKMYSDMRAPRTFEILNQLSQSWGDVQQMRAHGDRRSEVKEEMIRRDVFFHESIHHILPGVKYDYKEEVINNIQTHPLLTVPEETVCW